MVRLVTTQNGSIYRLDLEAKTWERVAETNLSGDIRSSGGPYTELRDAEVGKRMTIVAPGLAFGNRWIHTSVVTGVKNAE